jgi:hypothetical protein
MIAPKNVRANCVLGKKTGILGNTMRDTLLWMVLAPHWQCITVLATTSFAMYHNEVALYDMDFLMFVVLGNTTANTMDKLMAMP